MNEKVIYRQNNIFSYQTEDQFLEINQTWLLLCILILFLFLFIILLKFSIVFICFIQHHQRQPFHDDVVIKSSTPHTCAYYLTPFFYSLFHIVLLYTIALLTMIQSFDIYNYCSSNPIHWLCCVFFFIRNVNEFLWT
jgi:hypothetical protein